MTFQEELKNLGERSGERALTESIIAAYEALLEADEGTSSSNVWLSVNGGTSAVPLDVLSKAIRDHDRLTLCSLDKDALNEAKAEIGSYFNPYYVKTDDVTKNGGNSCWSFDITYNDVVKGNKAHLVRLYNKITDYVNSSVAVAPAAEQVTEPVPDSKVYVNADGSQVIGMTWGDDPQNIDPDLDEDDPESYLAQGYNCYTYADLYDVDEGFDLSKLPADPWELDSLEGKGLSLVANMEQHMYKKSELPSDEDALGEYVNPDEGWKLVSK
jgi:hypothetical protein